MKIDLHVHTKERSSCAITPAREQIKTAINRGLDALVFTDHGKLLPEDDRIKFNEEFAPFRIIKGIEITIEGEDVIVFGIDDIAIEKSTWDYPSLHTLVRKHDGFMAIAHPFRYRDEINVPFLEYPPDAIEICSVNIPLHVIDKIQTVARELNIPVVCNSDAHEARLLGKHYNVLNTEPQSEKEIITLLKAGEFTAVTHDSDGTITPWSTPENEKQ